jgi:hypothetical protein
MNAGATAPQWTTLAITQRFESAQQTITSGGSLTIAHGLGVQPKLWAAFIQCTSAEFGYSVGYELEVPAEANASFVSPIAIVPDATNMNVRFGSNASVFYVNNFTDGTSAQLKNTKWKFVVRAWA